MICITLQPLAIQKCENALIFIKMQPIFQECGSVSKSSILLDTEFLTPNFWYQIVIDFFPNLCSFFCNLPFRITMVLWNFHTFRFLFCNCDHIIDTFACVNVHFLVFPLGGINHNTACHHLTFCYRQNITMICYDFSTNLFWIN